MTRRPPGSPPSPNTTLYRTPAALSAQYGSVRGRVADSTGVPVAQASVVLEPSGARASSNERGEFVLSRVPTGSYTRSEEHTSELQSRQYLVCRLQLEKKHVC